MGSERVKTNQAALLVIDVQVGLFEKSNPVYNADQLLDNIDTLVDRAHLAGAPVFLIQHGNKNELVEESPAWQLHPRLQPTSNDCLVRKHNGSALQDTGLGKLLAERNVDTLVIAGLVTHGCVKATCLDAHKSGYHVILVQDAHSNYHAQAKEIIEEWNQKLADGIVELRAAHEVEF